MLSNRERSQLWGVPIIFFLHILSLDGYVNRTRQSSVAVFQKDWIAGQSWFAATSPAPVFQGLSLHQAASMMGTQRIMKERAAKFLPKYSQQLQKQHRNSTLPKHYDLRTSTEGIKCGGLCCLKSQYARILSKRRPCIRNIYCLKLHGNSFDFAHTMPSRRLLLCCLL
jgi:hypothetical protein